MEESLNRIQVFFAVYPEYVYLIIGIVFLVLFIGVLMNKNRVIDPESGKQRMFYRWFGRKPFRIAVGIVFLLGTISGFSGYCLYSQVFKDIHYNNPINVIERIKIKNSYTRLDFTIETYAAMDDVIVGSFMYKGRKARVKFDFDPSGKRLRVIRVGDESDYFLYAISELYDEKLSNTSMKDVVEFSIQMKGDNQKIDLFNKESTYVLTYKSNYEKDVSLELRMTIDMESGTMELWEKNGGILKKNLIKAFENE